MIHAYVSINYLFVIVNNCQESPWCTSNDIGKRCRLSNCKNCNECPFEGKAQHKGNPHKCHVHYIRTMPIYTLNDNYVWQIFYCFVIPVSEDCVEKRQPCCTCQGEGGLCCRNIECTKPLCKKADERSIVWSQEADISFIG